MISGVKGGKAVTVQVKQASLAGRGESTRRAGLGSQCEGASGCATHVIRRVHRRAGPQQQRDQLRPPAVGRGVQRGDVGAVPSGGVRPRREELRSHRGGALHHRGHQGRPQALREFAAAQGRDSRQRGRGRETSPSSDAGRCLQSGLNVIGPGTVHRVISGADPKRAGARPPAGPIRAPRLGRPPLRRPRAAPPPRRSGSTARHGGGQRRRQTSTRRSRDRSRRRRSAAA